MLNSIFKNKRLLILLDQALFSGTSFLLTIFLARNLDTNVFGVYSGLFLGIFLFVSLSSALIINPFQVNWAKQENSIHYISFTFYGQISLVFFAILIIVPILEFTRFNELSFHFLLLFIGYVIHDYFRKIFLALDQAKKVLIFDSLSSIGQFIIILKILFTASALDLNTLFFWLGVAYIPSLLYGIVCIKPKKIPLNIIKTYVKLHYEQGKWLFMTALVQWWSGNLFIVASGYYLGSKALGALRLAQSLFGVLNVLLQTFENYILPQTSKIFATSKVEAINYLNKMTKYAGIVFIPFLIIIFSFSSQIMKLAGGDHFVDFAYVLKGMSVLYVLIYICQPIRIGIRILVLNNYFFFGYLIILGFSFLFSNYLLTHYALWGALIGLITSQAILLIFWQFILSKHKFNLWKSFTLS